MAQLLSYECFFALKGSKLFIIIISMMQQFHNGLQARVQNGGEYSEPFMVTKLVKQGCVMTPTLFYMMFSAMLTYAF